MSPLRPHPELRGKELPRPGAQDARPLHRTVQSLQRNQVMSTDRRTFEGAGTTLCWITFFLCVTFLMYHGKCA